MLGIKSKHLEAEPMKETDYHVTDIDFAMKDIGMTKILFKMSELRKEIQMCNARKAKSEEAEQLKLKELEESHQAKFDLLKQEFLREQGAKTADSDPSDIPFVFAFVSFRSMKGFDVVAESY